MITEALARAANSQDLEMEAGRIHDVDRLAAMAHGNALGGLLMRFREGAQPQWGNRIVEIIAKRIMDKHPLTRPVSVKVAMAALGEYLHPHCEMCNGAREVIIDQVRVVCSACDGSGKQRYGNTSRRAAIGTYSTRIDRAMSDAHTWMSNAQAAFLAGTTERLR